MQGVFFIVRLYPHSKYLTSEFLQVAGCMTRQIPAILNAPDFVLSVEMVFLTCASVWFLFSFGSPCVWVNVTGRWSVTAATLS